MAEETPWNCPVCREAEGEVASIMPCLHVFCLGCIVRWAKKMPSCPLCRQAIHAIIYSVRSEEDFLEVVLEHPSNPLVADQEDEEADEEQMPIYVAGFPAELWATFFQESPEILEPLLPWLNQELSALFSAHWWEEALAESTILANLCRFGLNEEVLVRELQPILEDHTEAFVRQLISVAADRCTDQIRRQMGLLDSHTDEEQDSPPASPGPSAPRERTPSPSLVSSRGPAVSSAEEEEDTSTLEAPLRGSPGRSPSPLAPAEQEQPQDEAAAVAGPSGQGCTRSPSPPGQDRDCLPGGPRRPQKRRASGPQDPPQPCKRPSRRRRKRLTLSSRKKK
ncbi:E3 ubiquitin-protein ligase Topors-like [Chiroxiphia lanceolata]|uniref:E3 ubiquitin-protein ligase Topors-like n=1 Tax=Chiroxiphia lanceolata TaxID=296741 RepID=UPI0013CEB6AB|nr:E3 ubiquitin-protein ligase Topors-like [Chiroxiphia lanceolata]